jgi:hypothetical protein
MPYVTVGQENSAMSPDIASKQAVMGINQIGSTQLCQTGNKGVDKMIKCKDFAPRITKQGPFGGPSEYESFSEVISAVN